MSSSYKDALKLSSPQVDEFIIQGCFEINKYISGWVHPMRVSISPQLDGYIVKSTSERVHPIKVSWYN